MKLGVCAPQAGKPPPYIAADLLLAVTGSSPGVWQRGDLAVVPRKWRPRAGAAGVATSRWRTAGSHGRHGMGIGELVEYRA